MARDFAEGFYKSPAWAKCRAAYAKQARGLCEDCLEKGLIEPGVIVHHMTPITPENINDPAITLNWKKLRLLCRDCHGKRHSAPKRYTFDALGNVIPVDG